ncbi:MAG: hypothetical protein DHS20C09_04350 [marine bacterium B5-7]|nr:MAG: hypothetical protein DHS20C09_04350 [marine bacterium B5-7]
MKMTVLIILFLILLTGCFATTENYEAALDTWVGYHTDDLVTVWGVPSKTFTKSDGGMVLEFYNQRSAQIGGHTSTKPVTTYHSGTTHAGNKQSTYSGTSTTYVTETIPAYNLNFYCKTTFITNSMGNVTSWRWEGNDCKSK